MRKLQVRDFEIQKCEIMRDSFSFIFLIILFIFVAFVIGFIFVIFCPSAAAAKKCPRLWDNNGILMLILNMEYSACLLKDFEKRWWWHCSPMYYILDTVPTVKLM